MSKRDSNSLSWTGGTRRADSKGERGATLVEAAFVFGLLFLSLFAVVEFGMFFKDYLSVSNASRTGARAGATYGNNPNADIEVLRNVELTLSPIGLEDGDSARIFDAESPGIGTTYTYRPGTNCGSAVIPALPDCCDWSPCPEVGRTNYQTPLWDPADRDITAPVTDRIAVGITFTHQWVTGFFGSETDLTTQTDFQIEPQLFDA